jgi:hypothetical protein
MCHDCLRLLTFKGGKQFREDVSRLYDKCLDQLQEGYDSDITKFKKVNYYTFPFPVEYLFKMHIPKQIKLLIKLLIMERPRIELNYYSNTRMSKGRRR